MLMGDERSERGCESLVVIILEKGSRKGYNKITNQEVRLVFLKNDPTENRSLQLQCTLVIYS